jgi:hypothetical protein
MYEEILSDGPCQHVYYFSFNFCLSPIIFSKQMCEMNCKKVSQTVAFRKVLPLKQTTICDTKHKYKSVLNYESI